MKVGTYDTWDEAIAAIGNHWYADDLMEGAELFPDPNAWDNFEGNSMKSRWIRSSNISLSIILIISGLIMSFNLVPITAILITATVVYGLSVVGLRFLYGKKPEYTLYRIESYPSKYGHVNKFPISGARIDYYIQSNEFSGSTNHKVRSYVAPDIEYLRGLIVND